MHTRTYLPIHSPLTAIIVSSEWYGFLYPCKYGREQLRVDQTERGLEQGETHRLGISRTRSSLLRLGDFHNLSAQPPTLLRVRPCPLSYPPRWTLDVRRTLARRMRTFRAGNITHCMEDFRSTCPGPASRGSIFHALSTYLLSEFDRITSQLSSVNVRFTVHRA